MRKIELNEDYLDRLSLSDLNELFAFYSNYVAYVGNPFKSKTGIHDSISDLTQKRDLIVQAQVKKIKRIEQELFINPKQENINYLDTVVPEPLPTKEAYSRKRKKIN